MRQKTLGCLVLICALSLFGPKISFSWPLQARCDDVADRGHLNVLTINLLFSEIENRESRLQAIADFIAGQSDHADIILLQEVVGGSLAGTGNSSLDLQHLLAERELGYNFSYRLANGLPGILSVGNAILSRCEILYTLSQSLPFVTEVIFDGFQIPLRRNVMMSRVSVPGFGKINVYNTHLCAYCDPLERLEQANVVMSFLRSVEYLIPGNNPIILGGDFNIDLNIPDNFLIYDLITQVYGFTDTCGWDNGCEECCLTATDPGCNLWIRMR
jgi:maltose 6'-phosphate phosphatase